MVKKQTIEQVIEEALRLYDTGKTPAEICLIYPKEKSEIMAIFETIEKLSSGKGVLPRTALLTETLSKLSVTDTENEGYSGLRGDQGRTSHADRYIGSFTTIMNKWKVIVPVGVVALLLIVFIGAGMGNRSTSLTLRPETDDTSLTGIDGSLDESFDTEAAMQALNSEFDIAAKGSESGATNGTDTIDYTAFEKEMNAESGKVALDNNFDTFFAEESAMSGSDDSL